MGTVPNTETKQRLLVAVKEGTTDTVGLTGTADGRLNVEAKLEVGDIEIGAVEIKDSDTDVRATVSNRTATHRLATEPANEIVEYTAQTKVTVISGAGGSVILAFNADRRHVIIANPTNAQTVWIKIGKNDGTAAPAPVEGEGIPIFPKTAYQIDNQNLATGQIKGIASAATVDVSVAEGE